MVAVASRGCQNSASHNVGRNGCSPEGGDHIHVAQRCHRRRSRRPLLLCAAQTERGHGVECPGMRSHYQRCLVAPAAVPHSRESSGRCTQPPVASPQRVRGARSVDATTSFNSSDAGERGSCTPKHKTTIRTANPSSLQAWKRTLIGTKIQHLDRGSHCASPRTPHCCVVAGFVGRLIVRRERFGTIFGVLRASSPLRAPHSRSGVDRMKKNPELRAPNVSKTGHLL